MEAAIRVEMGREYPTVIRGALPLLCRQEDRTGTITKQHTGAAVGPIQNPRKCFRANHKRGVYLAGLDKIIRRGQRVNETRANRLDVKTHAAVCATQF